MEAYSDALGGQVRALSVDLVVSPSWGDLLDPKKQKLFFDSIMDGWVSGVASGPPCETWSKAREEHYVSGCGPRPLRSAAEPWGSEALTIKELQQLVTGNALLGVALIMFMAAWLSGTFAMLEHPVEPGSTVSASIWRLEVLQFLAGLPQVQKIVVFQGFFEARSPKPTTLLFAHAAKDVDAVFKLHQTRRLCPTAVSIGRNERGQYRTAELKAYPAALCRAMAAAWYASVKDRPLSPGEQISHDFAEAIEQLHKAQIGDSSMGPDFHGAHVQQRTQHGRRPA